MPQLSADARDLNWLVANFATTTPGIAHAMVVSADGLPVAVSDRLDRPMADQLAAIASGLAALSQGGASCMEGGLVTQTLVEMQRGLLFVTSIRDGSCLTVLAAGSCDVGLVGYEMAVLVTRVGDVLTPGCGPSSKPSCQHEHPDVRPEDRSRIGGTGQAPDRNDPPIPAGDGQPAR